jgi:hypothetical protein
MIFNSFLEKCFFVLRFFHGAGGVAEVSQGVAEDQTEGDVAAPQVRTYRPECSVRSEGSAT